MARFFDILLAGIALLILSPILLIVIVILRFTGENKIFYFQERVGKKEKIFSLIKFVTMVENSEEIGGDVTIKNDPRILPFGSFLRNSKINELPQLINIIIGDMSIVGFRPQTKNSFNLFSDSSRIKISENRPGLTGIGSLYFSNEEELLDAKKGRDINFYESIIVPYKENLEIWWCLNNNIGNYFYCIFLTALAVFVNRSLVEKLLWKSLPKPPEELTI